MRACGTHTGLVEMRTQENNGKQKLETKHRKRHYVELKDSNSRQFQRFSDRVEVDRLPQKTSSEFRVFEREVKQHVRRQPEEKFKQNRTDNKYRVCFLRKECVVSMWGASRQTRKNYK
jgi:hypothetical protein